MLRRILLLLDETPSSVAARQYAFRLAQEMNAELAGLAGVDLSFIEAPMPGGLGTAAYQAKLEVQLRTQAEASRARLHQTYERECKEHGLAFEWLSFEGDAIAALYLATETRDLMITGHDTAFHGKVHDRLSELLGKLLLLTPRPLIVCADEVTAAREVLIAYDGSVPAMRAVQMCALFGLGRGRRIHVTSIDASQELAARRAAGAAGFLRSHGYDVEASPISSRVHPAEVLRIEVADRNSGTLVMGAYGHRGFHELLFGSTTAALVENPPCALFVYH